MIKIIIKEKRNNISYYEYDALNEKCQETGKYHIFCFDMKDSKRISENKVAVLSTLLYQLYSSLALLERKRNQSILVKEYPLLLGTYQNHYYCYPNTNDVRNNNANYFEPLLFCDAIFITVYRDSIRTEEILDLFYKIKQSFNIVYSFHCNHGYYETNEISNSKT